MKTLKVLGNCCFVFLSIIGMLVSVGYVYYQIDDIEQLLNSIIDYQEMQNRTNIGYNSLNQREKEAYAKMAFKAGSR